MGYISAVTEEWDLGIRNSMNRPRGYWTKWNKSEKERQILYDFTYIWYKKNNKWTNKIGTVIDTESKQVVARGEEINRQGRLKGTNF